MANLSIKNIPEEVLIRLRVRAKGHHRSLHEEILAILEDAVRLRRLTKEEAYLQVKELGVKTGPESAAMVREDRDGR